MRMISFDKLVARQSESPSRAPLGSGQFPAIKDAPPMLFSDAAPLAVVPSQLPETLISSVLTAEIASIQPPAEPDDGYDYALTDELFTKLAGAPGSRTL